MIEAQYSVIRYMADPARGERLNLGVLLWTEGAYRLAVDPSAAERVIRENPRLDVLRAKRLESGSVESLIAKRASPSILQSLASRA
jgi:hypothetical protein